MHAQLVTRTKLFCGCANEVGGAPNSRTCPVCLGMPGALPVMNAAVVDHALRVAVALNARVSPRSGFARKNYFYPDLPKGYQITQFGEQLARGGHLDVQAGDEVRRVRIRQIHVEEDAGKSVHADEGGRSVSLVDMNRCGVPLVEIVTEPDIRSVEEADAFLTALRRLLVHLGVATGHMHEGSLRFDTNVSVRRVGEESLGTQTEIKNLNSFRSVRRALEHETGRQIALLESGSEVRHETLLWDESAGRAVSMRSKEGASDYRYFPEPDLVDFTVDADRLAALRETMPELPDEARDRLVREYAIPDYDASVLTAEPGTLELYERTVAALRGRLGAGAPADVAKTASNWVMVVLGGYLNERGRTLGRVTASAGGTDPFAGRLADVIAARLRGDVSEPASRRLFEAAAECDEPVAALIERLGLERISDEAALAPAVDEVLARHPDEVRRYRAGESKLMRFFVGQVMNATGGTADPEEAGRLLVSRLTSGGKA